MTQGSEHIPWAASASKGLTLSRRSSAMTGHNTGPAVPGVPVLKPDDIVIAVMGVTGSGKSTFISHFAKESPRIGHGLKSFTDSVEFFQCTLPNGREFYMIDTPGFDDSFKSDADILQLLADRLNEAYEKGIKLSGIIHLHRIMDNKVGGQALKDMRMFRKLCGDGNLESVVLATTRWADVELPVAEFREAELKSRPDFWKPLIDLRATVFRQDQGIESATRIVQHLIHKKKPIVPEISRDMVDNGKKIGDTAAGQEVTSQAERFKKYYEGKLEEIRNEIKEALETRNKDQEEELENLREEMTRLEEDKKLQDEALEKMQADRTKLRQEMDEKYEAENAELMEQLRVTTELLEEEEQRLEAVKEEGLKKDLALKAVLLENKRYKRAFARSCFVM